MFTTTPRQITASVTLGLISLACFAGDWIAPGGGIRPLNSHLLASTRGLDPSFEVLDEHYTCDEANVDAINAGLDPEDHYVTAGDCADNEDRTCLQCGAPGPGNAKKLDDEPIVSGYVASLTWSCENLDPMSPGMIGTCEEGVCVKVVSL